MNRCALACTLRVLSVAVFLAAIGVVSLPAQVDTGSITGIVTDASGRSSAEPKSRLRTRGQARVCPHRRVRTACMTSAQSESAAYKTGRFGERFQERGSTARRRRRECEGSSQFQASTWSCQ